MKEWREVFGTEAEQPEEFDTTASPTTVYQRRNIKKATKEDADGKYNRPEWFSGETRSR